MMLRKGQLPILLVLMASIIGFTIFFIGRENYEFLIYIGVIIVLFVVILMSNVKVHYSNMVLWGLVIWALMHMSGGAIMIGDGRLYELIILPLSDQYQIFRYDQLVHMIGFGVTTLLAYELLRPLLKTPLPGWTALSIVLVMTGLGFGALNEIVEFAATLIAPETGVGGYINTSLDLVANFVGAVLALGFIRWREPSPTS